MSEPTLDDLWVFRGFDYDPLTPAEFDRIAREWLREKLSAGATDLLDIPEATVPTLRAVLDALDGGQE